MVKCDYCKNLIKRSDDRKVRCLFHGLTHQRVLTCSKYEYKAVKRVSMLDWIGV